MIESSRPSSDKQESASARPGSELLWQSVNSFLGWLEANGYESYDPYDIWGTKLGLFSRAKYYKRPLVGLPLIAPFLLVDVVWPGARGLFTRKCRYATAEAQLGLAFLNLYRLTGEEKFLTKARKIGTDLLAVSVPGYSGHCWGYPFDWRHNKGLWRKNTPFITVTPYVFEFFLALFDATGNAEFLTTAKSIAQFVFKDFRDTPTSPDAAACGYAPNDESQVLNASAYRAMLLFEAARRFERPEYAATAQRNLNFILQNQRADGSWLYAAENTAEGFIDHFHTCFVIKSLFKINRHLRSSAVSRAITNGFGFYRTHLFRADGLPKPFAVKPRQQIVQHNMYDFAEAITLGALLWDEIPEAGALAERLAQVLYRRYQLADGHFVTRVHVFGLNHSFPFLRWPQAQLFYSLTNLLLAQRPVVAEGSALSDLKPVELRSGETPALGVSQTRITMSENVPTRQASLIDQTLCDRAINMAVRTLPRMLVPQEGRFCCEMKQDGSVIGYGTELYKSWRYTIMCLLGLARAQKSGHAVDVDADAIFQKLMATRSTFSVGDVGLLLWLAVRIDSADAPGLFTELTGMLGTCDVDLLTGMEVAWILVGLIHYCTCRGQKPGPAFFKMLDYFFAHRIAPSGLVYHFGRGFRRRFPNFATQIYTLHALSVCANLGQDSRCSRHAVALARTLIAHQRPNGGWPWLYDAVKGTVVEPFEVYSVHQHGMAPMAFLALAEATGFDVTPILAKSMAWLDGGNELQYPMMDEETGLIYRSVRRRSPAAQVLPYFRAIESCCGVKPGGFLPESAGGLEINLVCRPYELGWLLEAWSGSNLFSTGKRMAIL